MSFNIIKNDENLLKNEILELKNELQFIEIINNHFQNGDEYIITEDGAFFKEDSKDYRFSKYNQALIKQNIKRLEKELKRQNIRIVNPSRKNHLRLV
jgi:glycine/serine hydroxymethyltransferase